MRGIKGTVALVAALLAGPAWPQATSAPATALPPSGSTRPTAASAPVQLDTLVISGTLPGPGLWKVSKDGHALWILGTVNAVPKGMRWESREVDAVLAQAQEVIWAPTLRMTADIGFFQGLLLAPRLLGAKKNPDGKSLQDVVPAASYARWLPLKEKYIGRDRSVESWRPIFAADRLYMDAMDDVGLAHGGIVSPVIRKAIKARGLKESKPDYTLVIQDPKAALGEFRQSPLDDVACFDASLAHLDTDLAAMRGRANAWAVGDIEALRGLPLSNQADACMQAAMQSGVLRKRSQGDIDAEIRRLWLDAARKALGANPATLAVLPIGDLLKPDGVLSTLQAQGYMVEAPE